MKLTLARASSVFSLSLMDACFRKIPVLVDVSLLEGRNVDLRQPGRDKRLELRALGQLLANELKLTIAFGLSIHFVPQVTP